MMTRRFGGAVARAFVAAVVFGAWGCGSGGETSSLIDLTIRWVTGTKPGATDVDPKNGAGFLRFTVSGPGQGEAQTIAPFLSHKADLPPASYGYDRQLTVEVCATQECARPILARGRSVPTTVLEGDTRALDVFVTPTNSYSVPTTSDGEATQPTLGERLGATVTLLNDGRLLIAGGAKPSTQGTAFNNAADLAEIHDLVEIFDPRTNRFEPVGNLTVPRAFHQAVKLESRDKGGKVVFLGGYTKVAGGAVKPTSTVEMYDPDTGTLTQATEGLAGKAGRAAFTAGLAYKDQDVIFLAGGVADPAGASGYWDLYVFNVGAVGHGKLGVRQADAETGDPVARWNHTMTWLPNYRATAEAPSTGAFVLMGGENDTGTLSSVEAYVVDAGSFNMVLDESALDDPPAGSNLPFHKMPGGGRTMHQAVYVAQQGIVYVFGGFAEKGLKSPLNRIDIYREGAGGFYAGEVLFLQTARGAMSATLMDMNTIFVAGGLGAGGTPLNTAEVVVETVQCDEGGGNCYYTPVVVGDPNALPILSTSRYGHTALFDATRRVLVVGGLSQPAQTAGAAVYYNPD
jgi:hypothetical protein